MAACNPSAFDSVARNGEQSDAGALGGETAGAGANGDAAMMAGQVAPVPMDGAAGQQVGAPEAGLPETDRSELDARASDERMAADGGHTSSDRDGALPDSLVQTPVCGAPDDVKNCGRCGNDCSATAAQSMCIASSCRNRCNAGFADCNGDLAQGALGNGCEIDTQSNAKSCGSCGTACIAPSDGYATCRAATCLGYALKRGASMVLPAHGNPEGGEPFVGQLCPANEVLIGLAGFADAYAASSIGGQCGRLKLSHTQMGELISVIPSTRLAAVGRGDYTPDGAPFDVTCPTNMVVSEVRWSTWALWPEPTVKGIELVCSELSIGDGASVQVKPGQVSRAVGGTVDATRDLESIVDVCAPNGAVIGFAGRAGAHIDQLAVNCANLTMNETAADSQSMPDKISNVDELGGSTVSNSL